VQERSYSLFAHLSYADGVHLKALGELELEGMAFGREKPLLVLTYLALEGPQSRRKLAELFWPDASDPMNSLSVALTKLRKLGAAEGDESRAWFDGSCDAVLVREHVRAGRLEQAASLYAGELAVDLREPLGAELEDWLLEARETLAGEVREALLTLAEREASEGQFTQAAERAERAFRLPGAAALEPADLGRIYQLFAAADHPAREAVRQEATDLGVNLETPKEAARGRLRHRVIGRDRELEALQSLESGDWAWVRGGAGMGKTTVARELEAHGWRLLPGRSGLPFATIEALWPQTAQDGEDVMLRRLLRLAANGLQLVLDDWEAADSDSQRVLERARALRPECRVVITARGSPALPVDRVLELGPFKPDDLTGFPGAYSATDGIPELVGAHLRGDPLPQALEARLAQLPETARTLHGALLLLEHPDLEVARRALGVSAAEFMHALELLVSAGLIESNGQVKGRATALEHVDMRPNLEAGLALRLARQLSERDALPLYQRARGLWEDNDLEAVRRAYTAWAKELMRRGFPRRAADLLLEAPNDPSLTRLRARALERSGLYKDSLEVLERAPPETESQAELLALRSTLYARLGRPLEAREAAQGALEGPTEARAEAHNTMGMLALSTGDFAAASIAFRRAATLWRAVGDNERWLGALNNLAVGRAQQGEDAETAFREALEAAKDDPTQRSRLLINLGRALEAAKRLQAAEVAYREAAALAVEIGAFKSAAMAWNNVGSLSHQQGRLPDARAAYEQSLALSRQAGVQEVLGLALANLAELDEDEFGLEEAIRILKIAGQNTAAEHYQARLATFRGRSGGSAHS
jgi:tetratricopeptide (TPR) repeat protein